MKWGILHTGETNPWRRARSCTQLGLPSALMSIGVETIRLFLHVLGASVWVGGQIVLIGLVPVARSAGPDVPRSIARRFELLSWPFFGLTVVTGIWNVAAENPSEHTTG